MREKTTDQVGELYQALAVQHREYERQGAIKERERIIKLLEELEAVGSDPITFDYIDTKGLIALIKGETND